MRHQQRNYSNISASSSSSSLTSIDIIKQSLVIFKSQQHVQPATSKSSAIPFDITDIIFFFFFFFFFFFIFLLLLLLLLFLLFVLLFASSSLSKKTSRTDNSLNNLIHHISYYPYQLVSFPGPRLYPINELTSCGFHGFFVTTL